VIYAAEALAPGAPAAGSAARLRGLLLQQCNMPSKSIHILRLLLEQHGQASPRMLPFS
jgi:hypothetical protein